MSDGASERERNPVVGRAADAVGLGRSGERSLAVAVFQRDADGTLLTADSGFRAWFLANSIEDPTFNQCLAAAGHDAEARARLRAWWQRLIADGSPQSSDCQCHGLHLIAQGDAPTWVDIDALVVQELVVVTVHDRLIGAFSDFDRLVEQAPLPLLVFSPKGRIVCVNPAFRQAFGELPEGLTGVEAWWQRTLPGPAVNALAHWMRLREQGDGADEPVSIPVRIADAEGDLHRVEVRCVLFQDGGGVVLLSDQTALHATEEALSSARSRLERTAYEVTENIPVGTYTMVKPPGEAAARFSFMSSRFLAILGLTREQAESDPFYPFQAVHPDDRGEWIRKNLETFERVVPFSRETRLLVAGRVRWVKAESVPRGLPDGGTVWEGVLLDITEQKQTELALERARGNMVRLQLERTRIQERERLLQDMHDGLGWQLASARLRLRQEGLSPEDLDQLLDECLGDLQLIVDSSTGEYGSLTEALANARFRLNRTLPSGLEVHWTIRLDRDERSEPRAVLQTMRILQEAISNAIKHSGCRTLAIAAVTTGQDRLLVTVRDDGRGLDPGNDGREGGRGFGNMGRRAEGLGGSLTIQSTTPGVEVRLEAPWPLTLASRGRGLRAAPVLLPGQAPGSSSGH